MHTCNQHKGFSLIEVIIFILVLGIALSSIISVYIFTTRHSADSMLSLKTIALSQGLMDEILSKAYDENTPPGGGCVDGYASTLCTSATTAQALVSGNFGTNAGESRTSFDDIDDYHDLAYCGAGVTTPDASCSAACTTLADESGTDISTDYAGYSVCIRVSFAGNEMNSVTTTSGSSVAVNTNDAKRIDLILRDPLNARMTFTAYKANF